MLLWKTTTTLIFCAISFFGFNQDDSDTIWSPKHKLHAALSFENTVATYDYSSFQRFGIESVYFSQFQESEVVDRTVNTVANLCFELGYERVLQRRNEKKWLPWVGVIGSVRKWSFFSYMNAEQSNFEVIDTLTNSQGDSFIRGKGSEISYDAKYRNSMVGISASIRPYIYKSRSRKFAMYTGVGFTYDFGIKANLEVFRNVSNYSSLNETLYTEEITFDTETVQSEVFDLSSLSFTLGFTISQYYELQYSYTTNLSNTDLLRSGSGGHQIRVAVTPGLRRPEHLRLRM